MGGSGVGGDNMGCASHGSCVCSDLCEQCFDCAGSRETGRRRASGAAGGQMFPVWLLRAASPPLLAPNLPPPSNHRMSPFYTLRLTHTDRAEQSSSSGNMTSTD